MPQSALAPSNCSVELCEAGLRGLERCLRVTPVRVVEVEPWPRDRPIGEDLRQLSLGQILVDALAVERVENAEPLQGCCGADVRRIGDQRPLRSHFEPLASLLEFPAIDPAVILETPVDAGVAGQVGG